MAVAFALPDGCIYIGQWELWEAGRLVQVIGDAHDWDVNRRRGFQNDAPIGLTARHIGAAVVTSNGADFALLQEQVALSVLVADR